MKRTHSRPVVRRAGGLLLALAVTTGLGGCAVNSPAQTTVTMDPSDGSNIDVGSLQVRNLLLLSTGREEDVTVVGAIQNVDDEDVQVTLSEAGGASLEVEVGGREFVQMVERSEEGAEQLTMDPVDAAAGDTIEMNVSAGGEDRSVQVPVLAPIEYYGDLAPEDYTPSPAPEESPEESEGEGETEE